jgi:hypothetical protein
MDRMTPAAFLAALSGACALPSSPDRSATFPVGPEILTTAPPQRTAPARGASATAPAGSGGTSDPSRFRLDGAVDFPGKDDWTSGPVTVIPETFTTAPRQETAPARGASVTVPVGIGFTSDPSMFLLGGAIDFPLEENWTFGPGLQIGVDDDQTRFAPMIQFKRFFPLESNRGGRNELLPFVQGGAGFAYLEEDNRPGDDEEIGLLLAVGGGLRFRIGDRLTLGSQMLLNFLPGDVLDEGFYFSWEVVQVVFDF